ncbi:hypothetical protein ABT304_24540 [Nocardioides sp. NPDC000445]|uniref:hypothetical protein n=1 Tax=Nocardioides sp. NPDC000445 TaxID=3154257 RepID=UPI00331D10D2
MVQVNGLVGVPRWDGSATPEEMLRGILEYGVQDEPALPSVATFQVWPLPGPAVLTCRVCLVDGGSVPDFTEVAGAAIHVVESKELGTGIQFSTKHVVEDAGGEVTLHSVDLIFADDDAAMVFSLEQSFPALIAGAMPGLDVLKNAFRVFRPDGGKFVGRTPANVLNEKPWELVEDAR